MTRSGVDFHTYVAAGQVGLEQGWPHIYNQVMVAVEQVELSPMQNVQPFLSPPAVALATAPLGFLPYDLAYVLWAVLLFGLFAAALAWAGSAPDGAGGLRCLARCHRGG